MNYGSSTISWKPWRWMRLDLIFSMRDIDINSNLNPLTKLISSSRSTKFKDMLSSNTSQMITKTVPISMRIVISYAMKWGIVLCIWWKVNGNWENNIRISQWRKSQCRTNPSVRGKKQIQKNRTVRITVRDLSRKVNHVSKVIWDRKIITEFTRLISSTRIGKPVLMINVKVSKDKTLADWLIKSWSVLDETGSKTVHKGEEGWSIEEKEVRHWVK